MKLRNIVTDWSIDSRTKRIFTTAASAYLGRFSQGIVLLVTLPMAKQNLNSELFGVWMMLTGLISFLAFADMGVGNGVLNNITKATTTANKQMINKTLVAGYTITGLLGIILYCLWTIWILLSNSPTDIAGKVSNQNQTQVLQALTVFVIFFCINVPASLILRIQLGAQQGYLNGINQTVVACFNLVFVIITLRLGGGVPELIASTFGVQVIVNIINTIIWLQSHGVLHKSIWFNTFDFNTTKSLLNTGFMFFLLQISAAFAFQSDVIVITHTLGQAAYGDFAVVQKIFLFLSMIISSALVGLWPAFGEAMLSNNIAWIKTALYRSLTTVAIVSITAVSMLTLITPWIMSKWMPNIESPAWMLLIFFSIWTVIDSFAVIVGSFMNSANILKPQLILATTMSVFAFCTKWVLVPVIGSAGSVLSTIIAYSIICIPGYIYLFNKIFNNNNN